MKVYTVNKKEEVKNHNLLYDFKEELGKDLKDYGKTDVGGKEVLKVIEEKLEKLNKELEDVNMMEVNY